MKVLLINGYANHVDSQGKLTATLFNQYVEQLKTDNDLRVTYVEEYDRTEEINKWLWADMILIQFPIYWFNVPGALKHYFDDVFAYGIFYGFGDENSKYGMGGKMTGKNFVLSTTWNAPENAFNSQNQFFEGKDVSDVLIPTIKALEFVGIQPNQKQSLISFHDVVHHPNIGAYLKKQKVFVTRLFK